MAYPLDKFPASELPARLAQHTTSKTTQTAMGPKVTKVYSTPITDDKLEKDCEMVRFMQYDCQIVRMMDAAGIDLGYGGINCWEIERRFWRCQDGMMIEGTGLQKAWRDGGQSRKRSMDMVRQRWEIQREKKEARKQQQMERDLKLIAKGDDWS